MSRAALVVHSYSYPYIQNVARFIHAAIKTHFDAAAELLICNAVDEVQFDEGNSVFLIGEKFPEFRRIPGCTYMYLNFSVVTIMGQPWETGVKARRAIRKKQNMLAQRLPSIDVLLDYYAPQTSVLQRKMSIPVLGFDVATIARPDFTPMRDRTYDVCFVGGLSRRRKSVCDTIEAMGFSLSPSKDIVIEDAAAQSRVCLNVHSVKSHHFETPRFVAALSAGTPILTEPSFGARDVVDSHFMTEDTCARLPSSVAELLSQIDRLEDLGRDAQHWYSNTYLPRALESWRVTCNNVRSIVREESSVVGPMAVSLGRL